MKSNPFKMKGYFPFYNGLVTEDLDRMNPQINDTGL